MYTTSKKTTAALLSVDWNSQACCACEDILTNDVTAGVFLSISCSRQHLLLHITECRVATCATWKFQPHRCVLTRMIQSSFVYKSAIPAPYAALLASDTVSVPTRTLRKWGKNALIAAQSLCYTLLWYWGTCVSFFCYQEFKCGTELDWQFSLLLAVSHMNDGTCASAGTCVKEAKTLSGLSHIVSSRRSV